MWICMASPQLTFRPSCLSYITKRDPFLTLEPVLHVLPDGEHEYERPRAANGFLTSLVPDCLIPL